MRTNRDDRFSASEQGLGYLSQPRFALLQMLELLEETSVFIEKDDDLDFGDNAGRKSFGSLKHKAEGEKLATNELMSAMGNRNNAAARVVCRISLFLEDLLPNSELIALEEQHERLRARVADLELRSEDDTSRDRLASILNNISGYVSQFIRDLGTEFSHFPIRIDLSNLTIAFDRFERSVTMGRTGGGENHLAYHLATLLALHLFAVNGNRPIPRFLMIDQPTQVYFPSEQVYKEADGSVQKTEEDGDLAAARRLFAWLRKFCEELAPGFQIIVTEHANLRDDWFQAALVEEPWSKPPAFVPADWQDEPS